MQITTALSLCCALLFASGGYAINSKITPLVSESTSPSSPVPAAKPVVTQANKLSVPDTTPTTISVNTATPNITTPSPAPVPSPSAGRWQVNASDGSIIVRLAGQLEIIYNISESQNAKIQINIPSNSNDTKATAPANGTINLSWSGKGNNSVTIYFKKYDEKAIYTLSSIEVIIGAAELPDYKSNDSLKLVHTQEHFNTTLGRSYRCVKLQDFNLTNSADTSKVVGHLKVTDLQFQAFKGDRKPNFDLAEDCAFDTSDVVPIAVGCVLAGLVVVVLVAYLISRRRSQARGYLSM